MGCSSSKRKQDTALVFQDLNDKIVRDGRIIQYLVYDNARLREELRYLQDAASSASAASDTTEYSVGVPYAEEIVFT